MVAARFGFSSGSLSSSQSQSTISSTLSSTTKRISPLPVPPPSPGSLPSSLAGCSTSPGLPRPWPAPWPVCASSRRKRECSRNFTGTATVRLGRVIRSEPASRSGRLSFTAARTFWLCRSQSLAPLEKSSYQGVSAAMRIMVLPWEKGSGPFSWKQSWPACNPEKGPDPFSSFSFLCQQRRHVVERFTGAVGVVAVLVDQALLDHRDFLAGLGVGPLGGAHPAQHIPALLAAVLLARVPQRGVAVEVVRGGALVGVA